VTLTVTEKAYLPGQGQDEPGVPRLLATALAHRPADAPSLVIASLDNVADNGRVLRRAVLDAAGDDLGLRDRVARVAFPCSVVDRMVPATTDTDVAEVAERLGRLDLAAVVAERHRSWAITRVDGLPPLGEVGVEVVEDIEPYQRRKLWLLNGPHSAVAYTGLVAGCRTIAEAAIHPFVAPFVRSLVGDVLGVTDLPAAVRPAAFAADALKRFTNPDLGHTCLQVGADGSRKLPQRILPVVERAQQAGRSTERYALVVAAWLAAVAGVPVGGRLLPAPDDPVAPRLRTSAQRDLPALVSVALGGGARRPFHRQVVDAVEGLRADGARALRA
jgi:fructuronate reductase